MVKVIDPWSVILVGESEWLVWPGSHLEFFIKIQHVYGQKMIEWQTRISPGIFLKIQQYVKRWLTP